MFLPAQQRPVFAARDLVPLELHLPETVGSMYLVCARSMRYVPRIDAVLRAFERWSEQSVGR